MFEHDKARVRPRPKDATRPSRIPARAPASVHDVLRAPGQPLDRDVQGEMESRFGHDFSRVRVHTDAEAAESAQAVHASAYTAGPHVVFGAAEYSPKTREGRRLLTHELAHVVQQAGVAGGVSGELDVVHEGDASEREAAAIADHAGERSARVAPLLQGAALQRQPAGGQETGEELARRGVVIPMVEGTITRLTNALANGEFWPSFEQQTANGIEVVLRGTPPTHETPDRRNARLRDLIEELRRLRSRLLAGPVPSTWWDERVTFPTQGMLVGSPDPAIQYMTRVYLHAAVEQHVPFGRAQLNYFYLDQDSVQEQERQEREKKEQEKKDKKDQDWLGRLRGGDPDKKGASGTGIYIQVPDPVNNPDDYHEAGRGTDDRGPVFEVFKDSRGFFYNRSDSEGGPEGWYLEAKTDADITGMSPSWHWVAGRTSKSRK